MAEQQTPEISEADVQSLAQKLAQFNQTLTPGELAALAAVVVSGMPQTEDVQGYGRFSQAGGQAPLGVDSPFGAVTNLFVLPGAGHTFGSGPR